VTMPFAAAAAALAAERPRLSLGIHVDLTGEPARRPVDLDDARACRLAVEHQIARFEDLVQRSPSHIDAHHNVHRLPHLEPVFADIAGSAGVPHREGGAVRYFSSFYGQWDDGETHGEWISADNLMTLIDANVGPGITELACHPGLEEPDLPSSYRRERPLELASLCDAAVRRHIVATGIELISYLDVLPAQPVER
jgi:chitin disaccharide deacetylase